MKNAIRLITCICTLACTFINSATSNKVKKNPLPQKMLTEYMENNDKWLSADKEILSRDA